MKPSVRIDLSTAPAVRSLAELAASLRSAPRAQALRTYSLEDISIRSDGVGRTVEAYAAVFDVHKTVSDWEGAGYDEVVRRGSFARTIAQRAGRMQVLYNHGLDAYGNPSDAFSLPVGVPVEMSEDQRGLFTVTRYSKTPLGDNVLQLIQEGAIRAYSFGGTWVRSNPGRGPYRSGALVQRMEMAMKEYGPTPFPVYDEAEILAVRSITELADQVEALSPEERAELARLIAGSSPEALAGTGTSEAGTGSDGGETPPPPAVEVPPPPATEDPELELEMRRRRMQLEQSI